MGGMGGLERVFNGRQAVGTAAGVRAEFGGIYISAVGFALVNMVGFAARSFGAGNDDAV